MRTHPEVRLISYPTLTDDSVLNCLNYNPLDPDAFASDPELITERAGRMRCRTEHRPNPATATNKAYIRHSIIDNGNFRDLEHGMYVFEVLGVSQTCLTELVKHEKLRLSIESLRFCPPRDYAAHPAVQIAWDLLRPITERHWQECLNTYYMVYDTLTSQGLIEKRAREAAMTYLPLMTEVGLVVSATARGWWDALAELWDPDEDREVYELSATVFSKLRDVAPNIFGNFPLPA